MKAHYLVCYDITKPRRLARVLRLMKGKGIHLQYSVFFCSLTWPELMELKEDLRSRIKEKEDDIRIYPLPAKALVSMMGCGDRVPDGVELFIE
ncbi:MAG: CRISPR-associated endonuclease Cas2 [Alphaproteobacteria bacterium]|uniref:CRISPR-associated endoribonuclease Cas2 n=1 Tax=Candidatus Nitrobium versatile TaxID=2884831 RepID=A0A953JBI8_9BACT|nr:CRISPR-associated endonuclease Cas2 [Candidatus Nitrobium versatile]